MGYVQHQPSRALAFRGDEALQPDAAAQGSPGQQARLCLESDRAELGAHLAPAARLALLGLVRDLELDRRKPARGVAQRPELKQPAAQL
jgi:hypothetical protein